MVKAQSPRILCRTSGVAWFTGELSLLNGSLVNSIGASMSNIHYQVMDQVWDQVWVGVCDHVWHQFRDHICNQIDELWKE